MAVRVVTDSSSDLPSEMADQLGITIVPLNVHFGTEGFKDGMNLPTDRFYERLMTDREFPKTSQPSVCDGIVSVHVSSKLSGSFNSALPAKLETDAECSIEVADTSQASMGLPWRPLWPPGQPRTTGRWMKVSLRVRDAVELCQCIALFETIEYLR